MLTKEVNGESALGAIEARARLQRHEAPDSAQSIADCLEWPVTLIHQGYSSGASGDNFISAVKSLELSC